MRSDKKAIVEIYDDHADEVYGYCLRHLGSPDSAEDAVSAVFTKLVEKYPAMRKKKKAKADIRNWLYGTASNVIAKLLLDRKRHRETVATLVRQQQNASFPESDIGRLDWPVLYRAIAKLDETDQAVVVLRFGQDLETAAIAEALGMKHATVRSRLARAIRKLKDDLHVPFGE